MQLKTVEEVVQELEHAIDNHVDCWYSNCKPDIARIITQDRQDTITAVIDVIRHRQSGWLGNEEDGSDRHPHYDELQVVIDIITKLQALSPKE